MQTMQLNGYTAVAREPLLRLGTRDSYGTEQLQILPGEDWQGLVITATFVTPDSATRMVVPGDGVAAELLAKNGVTICGESRIGELLK